MPVLAHRLIINSIISEGKDKQSLMMLLFAVLINVLAEARSVWVSRDDEQQELAFD